ncbi:YhgE/Pip domain-containing protein [Luxibacter massiliensis]|uniref:YhgE/Pip domain-containing protein n=1 Tax=Luxibacter massiliensis TaxID=2219695 RepID=UPI000F05A848|nr:YhgE/Pip domain-containing protein [Luxibacter massiliensis]
MKNIWKIFQKDTIRIKRNVIALIVVIGITVVPCLYAWFNIAASWDPYASTGNLKVAVASADNGYDGSLIPIHLNMGDQVLSSLRENTQLEWVFTGEEKAIDGVKSGKYYAAIVIPKDFSSQMMSIFSSEIQKPEITYYSNAKKNAIAPKVTDKGATAIQTQINEIFTKTISDTALASFQTVSNVADQSGSETITDNLTQNLEQISSDLTAAANTLNSFSLMAASAQQMLDMTAGFLNQAQAQAGENLNSLNRTEKTFSGIQDTISGVTDGVNQALSTGENFYGQVSEVIDWAFQTQSDDAGTVADTLTGLSGRVQDAIDSYTSLQDAVASVQEAHPELSELTGSIIGKLNTSITIQTELMNRLNTMAESLRATASDALSFQSELKDLAAQSSQSISSVQSDYETNLQAQFDQLFNSFGSAQSDITGLLAQLNESASGIYTIADSASSDMSQLQETLTHSYTLLTDAASQIQDISRQIMQKQQNGDFSLLTSLLSTDREDISAFLAAPVKLSTERLYPIENYGSSMAPFYSTLSIWIGGIVLVAMLNVNISKSYIKGMRNVTLPQIYFGRYLTFLALGLMQSSLICLGDLFYLKIQCPHPFLFLLAGWVTSIVYVNIIYTLTVSFGDIGKAVSVVLLVIQVAGSGGTFPVEVAPAFFRAVYPLLPFTHSMAAMRECIGGFYGSTYWAELGKLGVFLIISLCLGLFLRKPIIRLNNAFAEKLESSKLM